MSADYAVILARVMGDAVVSPADVRAAFDAILGGAWTSAQTAAFAVALRMRGESAEIIVAAAEALRGTMSAVDHGLAQVVDTCGTGGDGLRTLNLSTAAAIVVAATGLHVAKHGNRSVSSQCGSADVVEALGIPIDVPTHAQAALLREVGIAFLMAPAHHPALRHAAEARRELGVRTIFNALGPLANPARATHQLVGVYEDRLRPIVARALGTLGVIRAWVVRGADGLDEVSPVGPTFVSELADGEVRERVITPADFGIPTLEPHAIAGADARANAAAIRAIVAGDEHAATNAVILNAAAVLMVSGVCQRPRDAAERARDAIASGAARRTLSRWQEAALRARGP